MIFRGIFLSSTHGYLGSVVVLLLQGAQKNENTPGAPSGPIITRDCGYYVINARPIERSSADRSAPHLVAVAGIDRHRGMPPEVVGVWLSHGFSCVSIGLDSACVWF